MTALFTCGWLIGMIVLNSDSAIIYINLSPCDIENLEPLVMNVVIKYIRICINQSYEEEGELIHIDGENT